MITDTKINSIQDKIKKALAQIEKDENVKIEFGTISYNPAKYTTTMSVVTTEKNERVDKIFESVCKRLGFTQNIIGMQFHGTNGVYEITDIKTKNRKYPVIATEVRTKKSYKFSVDTIKKILGGDKLINRNKNLDKLIDEQ
jgi:hypothetical protein